MFWIYAYLIILFIRPQDWPGSPVYAMPVNVVIMIGGLICGLMHTYGRNKNLNIPQTYLVLIFVCLAFISNAANGNVDIGSEQFIMLIKRYLLYIMILLIVDTPQKIGRVLVFSIMLAVILSFQGIYQNIHGIGWAQQGLHTGNLITQEQAFGQDGYGNRVFWLGDWDGPNVLALVYLVSIPFCMEFVLKKGSSVISKALYSASFLLLVYGVYLTNSRGGFLTLVVIAGLYYVLRFGKVKGAIAAVIVVLALLAFSPSRMSALDSEESSAHERTWLWEQGLNMLREKPIFGIGKGQFNKHAELIAHNNFVDIMTETGTLGLFVYIALAYLSIKGAYIVHKHSRNIEAKSELSSLSRAAIVSAIGFFAATFFVMMELELLYVIWALCAVTFLTARDQMKDIKLRFNLLDAACVCIMTIGMIMTIWLIAEKHII